MRLAQRKQLQENGECLKEKKGVEIKIEKVLFMMKNGLLIL